MNVTDKVVPVLSFIKAGRWDIPTSLVKVLTYVGSDEHSLYIIYSNQGGCRTLPFLTEVGWSLFFSGC